MGWEWWLAFAGIGIVSLCLGVIVGALWCNWARQLPKDPP